jgi:DNA-binding MurR/RpiR family transcriptional regulator
MAGFLRIEQMRAGFSKSEEKIADYILENESKIPKFNVKEFADSVGTSTASIVRFAKKLGYQSFVEFRLGFLEYLKESESGTTVYEAVEKSDSMDEIIDKISSGNSKAILDTAGSLNAEMVAKAVDAIIKSERVYFFGVGQSALVAEDFQLKLMRIGKDSIFYKDTHSQLASSVHLKKGDLAIGISNSGSSMEVFKALEKAKSKGATIISITTLGRNPISQLADMDFHTIAEEKNYRTGAIVSRMAQLTIVDILFIGVARMSFEEVRDDIKETRSMVESLKLKLI